jgi:hypothetical protein
VPTKNLRLLRLPNTRFLAVFLQWQTLACGVAGYGLQSGKILPFALPF